MSMALVTHLVRAVPPAQREPVASSRSVDMATDSFKGATKVYSNAALGYVETVPKGAFGRPPWNSERRRQLT